MPTRLRSGTSTVAPSFPSCSRKSTWMGCTDPSRATAPSQCPASGYVCAAAVHGSMRSNASNIFMRSPSSSRRTGSALGNGGDEDDEGLVRAVDLGGADDDGLPFLEGEGGGDQIAGGPRGDPLLSLLGFGGRPGCGALLAHVEVLHEDLLIAGGAKP